ncbi:MAG: hypothetical protein ACREXR_03620, partial [Gammaproteobacteria bacterium]
MASVMRMLKTGAKCCFGALTSFLYDAILEGFAFRPQRYCQSPSARYAECPTCTYRAGPSCQCSVYLILM